MNSKHVKMLSYAGAIFLVILSILALTLIGFVAKEKSSHNESTITVSGTAEVLATPDIATFSFTVSEVAETPEEAQKVISEKVSIILDGLDSLEIDEKDIKTNSYTISPRYEWVNETTRPSYFVPEGKRIVTGYTVSQSVEVKLRDIDMASEALTLFAEQGVNNLYGPQFEIDEPEELQAEARKEAIDDAQQKAEELASDLGVTLGDIVSFNENTGGYYPIARYRMDTAVAESSAGASPELPTGENTITSNVTITYTIK